MNEWIFDLVEQGGPFGVFLLMFLETVFPPIPSEVIMPVAGVVAAGGQMSLSAVIAAGTAGAMAGNLAWYALARMIGLARLQLFINRYGRWLTLDWADVDRAERLFGRFGATIVMIGRLIPTIRSVVSLPAGMVRMHFVRFLLWSTVGTALWSSGLAIAGWLLGKESDLVERILGPLSTAVIVSIVALYLYRQLMWRKAPASDDI